MAKRSERLKTVLKLAQLRQQQAAERLGEMTRNAQAQELQADQLKHYQLDYREHFKALGDNGASPSQLRNFQGFYRNLEQAIDTQGERALLARDQREVARQQWQRQYAREKNLQKLVERRILEEELQLDKKLQREQDDRPRRKPL